MTKGALQERWWKRGFTCNLQKDPAGKRWAAHQHSVDEIVRGLKGRIRVEAAGRRRVLGPAQQWVVPAHTVHHIENPAKESAQYFYGFRTRK